MERRSECTVIRLDILTVLCAPSWIRV